MKTKMFLLAVFCLLASASQMSAQLIIRNNGHAEVGANPNSIENDIDTTSVLKVFGDVTNHGCKGRIAFGDSAYVSIGEYGATNTDQRTPGDVIVKSGVEYEIEASGTVRLEDGFMVEKGATFAIYPSCF